MFDENTIRILEKSLNTMIANYKDVKIEEVTQGELSNLVSIIKAILTECKLRNIKTKFDLSYMKLEETTQEELDIICLILIDSSKKIIAQAKEKTTSII